ncbi:hypothetical protein ABDB91_00965 [Desulfoscipio sp. XC116]|uniref:hypothetical protein n=1 Tax=Desulfoscipio sp. XC116 TaxID=3144975 RepID=UPI00325AD471
MKKNKLVFFTLLIAFLILCFGTVKLNNLHATNDLPKLESIALDKTGSNGKLAELTLKTNPPQMPQSMKVYKVINPELQLADIRETANKLKINSNVEERNIDFRVFSADGDYIVDRSTGSFSYMTQDFTMNTDPISILNNKEYVNLAKNFLQEKGLFKEEAFFKSINEHTVTSKVYGKEVTKPFMVEVMFSRNLNNYTWTGVGPKISVYFGDHGKVIGAASVWRDVEEFEDYPLISPQQAIKQIEKGNATVFLENVYEATGEIENIELIYLNKPLGYEQKYVIPHYMFQGHTSTGHKFKTITCAVPQRYITEIPHKDNKVESTPRMERKLTPDDPDEY